MRLIVAGGRDFADAEYLRRNIANVIGDHPLDQLVIVSGGAKGADSLGEQWAAANGVKVNRYPAKWGDVTVPGAVVGVNGQGRQYNKLAGFQRNDLMADNADAVLVMPGGSGTAHMVKAALAKGLTVFDARNGNIVSRTGGGTQAQPSAQPARGFEIVGSRGQGAQFDVLGMRDRRTGATMATVTSPGEPGWLGNPFVANDAGGTYTREQATALFGKLVREKAQDPAWREAFLALEGKRVGYYKPDEEAIHLHGLQDWIMEERAAKAPSPAMPEQPAAAVNPTSQQAADAVQLDLWGKGRRFAGEAWPYLAAAGGAGALGLAVMQLQDGQEREGLRP